MPTFVNGLPLHVLVVHAVVVLVPLAVLGTVLIAVSPAIRRRYGWAVLVLTAVATASIPVATSAGEGLEHSLPRSPEISAHTHLGDQLLPFAAAMLIVVAGLMVLHQRYVPGDEQTDGAHAVGSGRAGTAVATRAWVRPVTLVLAVVAVVLAVVTAVQVVRIGDSGSRAAWGDTQYVQQSHNGPDSD